jgi:hypothetical protein
MDMAAAVSVGYPSQIPAVGFTHHHTIGVLDVDTVLSLAVGDQTPDIDIECEHIGSLLSRLAIKKIAKPKVIKFHVQAPGCYRHSQSNAF